MSKRDGYREFGLAREYVRGLGLKSLREWKGYVDSGLLPEDIPSRPWYMYKEWQGLRDWLTWTMSYDEAKRWLRENGVLNSAELMRRHEAGEIPFSVPKYPRSYYTKTGEWKGDIDFFMKPAVRRDGVGNRHHAGDYVSYEELERMVMEQEIHSLREYHRAIVDGRLLRCPYDVRMIYRDKWKGSGVLFKTGRQTVRGKRLSFEDGRSLARQMAVEYDLHSEDEYRSKCHELVAEGKMPEGLTSSPHFIYNEFTTYADWLGCERRRPRLQKKQTRSVEDQVLDIQKLGIRTFEEWERKKYEISKNTYISMSFFYFHGYRDKRLFGPQFGKQPYPVYADAVVKAGEIAIRLGIRTSREWVRTKIEGLPRNPQIEYKGKGWVSWKEWLGVKDKDFTVVPFDPSKIRQEHVVYQSRMADPEKEEKWVDIWTLVGFEWALGYRVSNFGRVFIPSRNEIVIGHEIGGWKKKNGRKKTVHLAVSMIGNPKDGQVLIHRLVAMAFIPNPDGKPFVNHIDGNSKNNASWNLEWVTQRENNYHAILTGLRGDACLDDKTVYEIKVLLSEKKHRAGVVARQYGIGSSSVQLINEGRTYRYIGKEEFTYPLNGRAKKFRVGEKLQEEICQLHKLGMSLSELAKKFNLCKATVYSICHTKDRNIETPRVVDGRVSRVF